MMNWKDYNITQYLKKTTKKKESFKQYTFHHFGLIKGFIISNENINWWMQFV